MPAALLLAIQALGMLGPLIPSLEGQIKGLVDLFHGDHTTAEGLTKIRLALDVLHKQVQDEIAKRLAE